MTNDLLEAADRASRSYWDGSDKSRIILKEAMIDLRVAVNLELKKRAHEDTARLERQQ